MLEFWELAPSPNNAKIRMALRFKGIDFKTTPVDPRERAALLEVSGQELTPVIADRGIVLNDSEAILQYLDANYRDAPRLFPAERAGRATCDEWKRTLDARIVPHWRPIFLHAIGVAPAPEESARGRYLDALRWLEEQLGSKEHFKGPELPICDLRAAQWATYGLPGAGLIARCRLFGKFRERFGVPQGKLARLERFLEPWNERLA